jgi:protein-L-isoaspartate(D-aspartate) O-methyltransferase
MVDVISEAFRAVPRWDFLPDSVVGQVDVDMPLPIGHGSTNSQPSTVRRMLQWLEVEPGQRILDVGSGSGWTTALLAHLTGQNGYVVAVEKVPDLVEFGQENCDMLGIKNVEFHRATDTYGWPDEAPYQRILVSADARDLPDDLTEQLAPGGIMVIPVAGSIFKIEKEEDGELTAYEHPGYAFVPLV